MTRIQFSDNENTRMRLPKIGNIRKGVKVPVIDKNTKKPALDNFGKIKTYPKEVPHFVVSFDVPGLQERFEKAYGKEPVTINCFLAASDVNRVWMSAYEAYSYSEKTAASDGVNITYLLDPTTSQKIIINGVISEMPTNSNGPAAKVVQGFGLGDSVPFTDETQDALGLTPHGRLNVIVAELNERAFLTVHTGGRYGDVPHLEYMVDEIFDLAEGINRSPIMIPFTLTRYEVERKYKQEGKTKKRVGWDIMMRISDKVFEGVMQAYQANPIRLIVDQQPKMFEAPEDYIENDEQVYIPETSEVLPLPETIETEGEEYQEITIGYLIEQKIINYPMHGESLFNLLEIPLSGFELQEGLERIDLYRKWREALGGKSKEDKIDAAQRAINGEVVPDLFNEK